MPSRKRTPLGEIKSDGRQQSEERAFRIALASLRPERAKAGLEAGWIAAALSDALEDEERIAGEATQTST
jgi:membrane-bound lytic murein transglycosylase B